MIVLVMPNPAQQNLALTFQKKVWTEITLSFFPSLRKNPLKLLLICQKLLF